MNSTVLCNSRVKYIRPKYKDLKECLEDENNVYIGRKGIVFINGRRYPEKDSIWANPFKVGKDGSVENVLWNYKEHIIKKINEENLDIMELKDKRLYCFFSHFSK
jgi:hypothetical protein